ncbi:MAG TPA: phosphoribosyltransferase [Polyangiaceae bacterium]|nr:phosphoribosyltransferase [Polyangiaceae bacterium]
MARAMRFQNRRDAGRHLAALLRSAGFGSKNPLVLALPRGGVPVGYEVARALRAPLDVFVVRKLGAPGHEELALGAVSSNGVRILNQDVVEALGVPADIIDAVAARELLELERRERAYREGRPAPPVWGRTVILVDDGLATGATMRAAVAALRRSEPAQIVVAVPVASPAAYDEFSREVDAIACVFTPEPFHAVGLWYQDFTQTEDEEVRDLLGRSSREIGPEAPAFAQASPS